MIMLLSHQVAGPVPRKCHSWKSFYRLQLLKCCWILLFRTPAPGLPILYLNAAIVRELTTPISNPWHHQLSLTADFLLIDLVENLSMPTFSFLNSLSAVLDNPHILPTHFFPSDIPYKYE